MLNAAHIIRLHDEANSRWHDTSLPDQALNNQWDALIWDDLILAQHRANFDLWDHEDASRDPHASDHDIAGHKHAIDTLNQQRNDLVEQIDLLLLASVPAQDESAPLHSETPGMMIDRLSILSLKYFHTEEETHRASADPAHHQRNRDRLAVLNVQRGDLAGCLDDLWPDIQNGRRRFKLYRQLKMYNDPDLNPVLYRSAIAKSAVSGEG